MPREQTTGERAEDRAAAFLETLGYRILKRNFRTRFGEVDIVADHDETLVLVEVKQRANENFSSVEETLTSAKRKKLFLAGRTAAARFGRDKNIRFDLVALVGDPESAEIRHYANVLSGVDI